MSVFAWVAKENVHFSNMQIIEQTAAVAGVPKSIVNKMQREQRMNGILRRPPKAVQPLQELDVVTMCNIRHIIYNFQIAEKKIYLSIRRLQKLVQNALTFKYAQLYIAKMVRKLGFQHNSRRDMWIERSDVRALRANFLRLLTKFRLENRFITYVEETNLFKNDDLQVGRTDKKRLKNQKRIIITYGWGKNGIIEPDILSKGIFVCLFSIFSVFN